MTFGRAIGFGNISIPYLSYCQAKKKLQIFCWIYRNAILSEFQGIILLATEESVERKVEENKLLQYYVNIILLIFLQTCYLFQFCWKINLLHLKKSFVRIKLCKYFINIKWKTLQNIKTLKSVKYFCFFQIYSRTQ